MNDKSKLTNKIAIYCAWSMAIGVPLGIFIWAYFAGKITQSEQLFNWLLALTVIFGGSILQYYLNKKHSDFVRDNHKVLNSKPAKKVIKKWAIVVMPTLVVFMILGATQLRRFDSIEKLCAQEILYLYSLIVFYLIYRIHVAVVPSARRYLSAPTYWSAYFLLLVFCMSSIPPIIAAINDTDSDENSEVKSTVLFNGHSLGTGKHRKYCYNLKHWEVDEKLSAQLFCHAEYPRVRDNEEVTVVVKRGNLNFMYVDEVVIPHLQSFKAYIDFINGESNLLYADMWLLETTKGRDFHRNISQTWIDDCKKETPYKCRLASYIHTLDSKVDNAKQLLNTGCTYGDFNSCKGMYLYYSKGDKEKSVALNRIIHLCEQHYSKNSIHSEACEWFYKEVARRQSKIEKRKRKSES